MAKKTKKNEKKYIYIIPAVLWMIFIFYMSSRTGDDSSAVSNPMTDFIVGLFQKVSNDSFWLCLPWRSERPSEG